MDLFHLNEKSRQGSDLLKKDEPKILFFRLVIDYSSHSRNYLVYILYNLQITVKLKILIRPE